MTIQQFIKNTQQGDWNTGRKIQIEDTWGISHDLVCQILLDPLAWKAVGKVEGWKDYCDGSFLEGFSHNFKCEECIKMGYVKRMHRFIDNLCDGLSLEEALNKATELLS